jgi:hypothetical protein
VALPDSTFRAFSIYKKQFITAENTLAATVAAEKMAVLAKGIKEILTAFATAKFLGSFTIDEEDIADKIFAESSFAEVEVQLRRFKSVKCQEYILSLPKFLSTYVHFVFI